MSSGRAYEMLFARRKFANHHPPELRKSTACPTAVQINLLVRFNP